MFSSIISPMSNSHSWISKNPVASTRSGGRYAFDFRLEWLNVRQCTLLLEWTADSFCRIVLIDLLLNLRQCTSNFCFLKYHWYSPLSSHSFLCFFIFAYMQKCILSPSCPFSFHLLLHMSVLFNHWRMPNLEEIHLYLAPTHY